MYALPVILAIAESSPDVFSKYDSRIPYIDLLVDIARRIEGNTICPLGDAAAWPVAAAVRHFRQEFEHHVKFPEKVKDPKHGHHEPIMPVAPAMVNA